MAGQIVSRATRQQRDRGEPGSQLSKQLYRPGQRSCLVRIIDNWGQRAVEIEAQGGRLRLRRHSGSVLGQYLVGCWRHDWWSSEKVCRSPGCKSTVSSRTKTVIGAARYRRAGGTDLDPVLGERKLDAVAAIVDAELQLFDLWRDCWVESQHLPAGAHPGEAAQQQDLTVPAIAPKWMPSAVVPPERPRCRSATPVVDTAEASSGS